MCILAILGFLIILCVFCIWIRSAHKKNDLKSNENKNVFLFRYFEWFGADCLFNLMLILCFTCKLCFVGFFLWVTRQHVVDIGLSFNSLFIYFTLHFVIKPAKQCKTMQNKAKQQGDLDFDFDFSSCCLSLPCLLVWILSKKGIFI